MTSTGSTSNGVLQYSLNMVVTVLSTTLAFARSVAVHSMNTSRVSNVICMAVQCVCLRTVSCSRQR